MSGTGHGEGLSYLLHLGDSGAQNPGRVGAKAANLAKLIKAGFPAPDGVVLTTEAFAHFAAANALPDPVAAALGEALARFGDQPLAVRSSGVAEDLEGASFAGQYETVLGVRGLPAVLEAVQTCWASAGSHRVSTYQSGRDAGRGAMAVLIQPLIAADAAGVAFTANPITGDRAEAMVSAVKGLGERLVSGEASPDEWRVKGRDATCQSAPEGAVTAEQVLAVAELARKVEAHFGAPQDIEWAWAGGRLYLLQARPITTLPDPAPTPVPVRVVPPAEGFWEREASHYPAPLSPLARTTLLPNVNRGARRFLAELSLLIEGLDHSEIGGWVYNRVVPLGGKDRPAPPAWVGRLLFSLVPPFRARIQGNLNAVKVDKAASFIERWYSTWKPSLTSRNEAFLARDLAALSAKDLLSHIRSVRKYFEETVEIHFLLNGSLQVMLAEFFTGCRELLGWDEAKAMELVGGLSETSSAPARAMATLAARARLNEELRQQLAAGGRGAVDRLAEVDPGFAQAFEAYVKQWARRAVSYDPIDPSLAERPDLLLGLVKDQLVHAYDGQADAKALADRRAEVAAEAHGRFTTQAERVQFDRLLARVERAYPVREEHGFFDMNTPAALIRYAYLEAGRRLEARQQLKRFTDIFFLEADEVEAALQEDRPYQQLVERRQGERAWVLANPGPASYGKRPGPPPLDALPEESRKSHEAILWSIEQVFAAAASSQRQTDGSALKGIAAAAGTYRGPVRVVRDESEFGKIQPGDVLVCPITSPVWSILFASVGALVTDTGGILSHSAIIAREYRIPAVVATGNATELLRDGQMVTVDGSSGKVTAG